MKKEIVRTLSEKVGISMAKTEAVINGFMDEIIDRLAEMKEGQYLTFKGFGSFRVFKRKERKLKNPFNSKLMVVPEKKVVTFKLSKKAKERINKG